MSLFLSPVHPFFCFMETYGEWGIHVLQDKILVHEAHKESKIKETNLIGCVHF